MDFKYTKRSIFMVTVASIIGFGVIGCGGGGVAAVATSIVEKDRATLDKDSSSSIATSLDGLGKTLGNIDVDGIAGGSLGVSVTTFAKRVARVTKMQPSTAGNTYTCGASGTVTFNNSNSGGSITFDHCIEENVQLNGLISVSGTETAGTVTINGFTIKTTNTYNDDTSEASIDSLQLEYIMGRDQEPESVELSAFGYAKTVVGGVEDRVDFKINQIKITRTTASFDGSVKTTCLGGWIVVTTPEEIVFNEEDLTAGKVVIAGNGSQITIEIAADGKATLTNADLTQVVYPNIEALVEDLSSGNSCAI